jgi:hypothetical protein
MKLGERIALEHEWETDYQARYKAFQKSETMGESCFREELEDGFINKWCEVKAEVNFHQIDLVFLQLIQLFRQAESVEKHPERNIGKRTRDDFETSSTVFLQALFDALLESSSFLQTVNSVLNSVDIKELEYVWDSLFTLLVHFTNFSVDQAPSHSKQCNRFIISLFDRLKQTSCNTFLPFSHYVFKKFLTIFHLLLSSEIISSSENSLVEFFQAAHLYLFYLNQFHSTLIHQKLDPEDNRNSSEYRFFITGNYSTVSEVVVEVQFHFFHLLNYLFKAYLSLCSTDMKESNSEGFFSIFSEIASNYFTNEQLLLPIPVLFRVLSNNDEFLINYLNSFLQLEVRMDSVRLLNPSNGSEKNLSVLDFLQNSFLSKFHYDSTTFFLYLMAHVFACDKQILLDLLSSNETVILKYLLLFLKIFSSKDVLVTKSRDWNKMNNQNQTQKKKKDNEQTRECPLKKKASGKTFLIWSEEFIFKRSMPEDIVDDQTVVLEEDEEESSDEVNQVDHSEIDQEIDCEQVFRLLHEVKNGLERNYQLQLIPFNPAVLCKRIERFLFGT